jgi:predicted Ser/Thr protein kinase
MTKSKIPLEKYSMTELKEMAKKMGLKVRREKENMIKDISEAFKQVEEYRSKKVSPYKKIKQLGKKGKEGTTFLVETKDGKEYAMKTFRKEKSSKNLKKEYKFLKKAGKAGVSPEAIDYDDVSKTIIMEKMDYHLIDYLKKHKNILSKKNQKRILEIFKTLDEIGIFHNDANLLNYMVKDNVIFLIDFGLAKKIDEKLIKKMKTDKPNQIFMLVGFILKLKDYKMEESCYNYLLKNVPDEYKEKYKL